MRIRSVISRIRQIDTLGTVPFPVALGQRTCTHPVFALPRVLSALSAVEPIIQAELSEEQYAAATAAFQHEADGSRLGLSSVQRAFRT